LELAQACGIIWFEVSCVPSISTSAYGYLRRRQAAVALKAIKDYLKQENKIEKVTMVLFSDRDLETYLRAAKRFWVKQ
jgi:O-acetyl-ADP-ribose deacetylase (regulator of RNase III)